MEMSTSKLTLELEPEWAQVLRPLTDQPLDSFVKELVVLELYRRRLISSGKAAELSGMTRPEFISYSSRLGIPFLDMSDAEFEAELGRINSLL
jgi:predicted HTH domain antitoxin